MFSGSSKGKRHSFGAIFVLLPVFMPLFTPEAEGAPAKALASTVINFITPRQMGLIARDSGYRALLVTLGGLPANLNPETVELGMAGSSVRIFFRQCDASKGCTEMLYRATFANTAKITAGELNVWNMQKPFVHAYLDSNNNVVLAMDVGLQGGISLLATAMSAKRFEVYLLAFKNFSFRQGLAPDMQTVPRPPAKQEQPLNPPGENRI